MSMLPLLALGAVLLFAGKKKKSEATVRVVEQQPPLKPLPVFDEAAVFDTPTSVRKEAELQQPSDSVFRQADATAAKESQAADLSQWGSDPLPQKTPQGTVNVVQPPLEMSEDQSEAVMQQPVPITPGQASEAAAQNPGLPVDEVVPADPNAAARELASYVTKNKGKGAKLGTKAAPSDVVRALQAQMGGLVTDGIYGPATRERGKALGVTMPPRG